MERDYIQVCLLRYVSHFNSHAHVERDQGATLCRQTHHHFNSHAHVERDWTSCLNSLPIPISTHTLTWSVTIFRKLCSLFIGISTHTLTWSVTVSAGTSGDFYHISTHTLTWSVTKQVADDLKEYSDFNSHAHVERDATILIL